MEIKELGRTPIPGTAPAGQDPRYEPEFEQLQAEIEKLSSVSAGGVADWPRIVDLASQVLSTKAKDLTAAAYLAVGLTQTRGLEGLALGTHLLDDLCAVFWEDCFPAKKRMRGRQAAFTWWQERSLAWLRALPGDTAVTPELSRDLIAGAEALDKRLGELMPDFPPLRNFLEALERLAPAEPQAQAAPQDAPAPQTTSAAAPQAQPAQAQPQDVGAARELLRSAALNFAALAVAETPTDPWIWRANRLASWIKIKALPPAEGCRTMIPAPEPSVKQTLQVLLSEGKFSEAARAAEEQVTASLFWLDPHRVAAKALEGLGPEYAPALAALASPLRFTGYVLAYLGGAVVSDRNLLALAVLAGGFSLVLLAALLRTAARKHAWATALPWLPVTGFGLCSALATAAGRSGFGLGQALESRYATFSGAYWMALAALFLLLRAHLPERPGIWLRRGLACCLALFLLSSLLSAIVLRNRHVPQEAARRELYRLTDTAALQAIFPDPAYLAAHLPLFLEQRLGPYHFLRPMAEYQHGSASAGSFEAAAGRGLDDRLCGVQVRGQLDRAVALPVLFTSGSGLAGVAMSDSQGRFALFLPDTALPEGTLTLHALALERDTLWPLLPEAGVDVVNTPCAAEFRIDKKFLAR
jgi:hypothetical protein